MGYAAGAPKISEVVTACLIIDSTMEVATIEETAAVAVLSNSNAAVVLLISSDEEVLVAIDDTALVTVLVSESSLSVIFINEGSVPVISASDNVEVATLTCDSNVESSTSDVSAALLLIDEISEN